MIPFAGTQTELRAVEERLAAAPQSAHYRLQRAILLDSLGRTAEARDAYIDVLRIDPTSRDALNNLGTLLFNARYRSAARLTYRELLKYHPRDVVAIVNLGNVAHEDGDLEEARQLYQSAVDIDPSCALAHQGLSYALGRLGDAEGARRHRDIGFRLAPIVLAPYRGASAPVTVLLLLSPLAANIATHLFMDDTTFLVVKVFAEYYDPALPLPPHDVVFNAIGDADLAAAGLLAGARLTAASQAITINPPQAVARTTRESVAQRLRGIEGVVAPRVERVARENAAGLDWPTPFLLRSPGYHTGEHFVRVDERELLGERLAELPGDELLVMEFLDARGADGATRKYRVMFVDGKMYPLHLARSTHWKVHYFSADLVHEPAAMEEEAAFLRDARAALPEKALRALESIAAALDLDYCGIDFALDREGNVLLFEANATMKIIPPVAGEEETPRGRAARAALDAARAMVLDRAREPFDALEWSAEVSDDQEKTP
jgi:hypothetical protein